MHFLPRFHKRSPHLVCPSARPCVRCSTVCEGIAKKYGPISYATAENKCRAARRCIPGVCEGKFPFDACSGYADYNVSWSDLSRRPALSDGSTGVIASLIFNPASPRPATRSCRRSETKYPFSLNLDSQRISRALKKLFRQGNSSIKRINPFSLSLSFSSEVSFENE